MKYIKLFENNTIDKYKISKKEFFSNVKKTYLNDKELNIINKYVGKRYQKQIENEYLYFDYKFTTSFYYIHNSTYPEYTIKIIKNDDYYYITTWNYESVEDLYFKADQIREFEFLIKNLLNNEIY